MRYLSEKNITEIGINWADTIDVIEAATRCLAAGDYAQPIKPYLRYRNLKNRIIAMPAFIGGAFNISGIKWIASFPDNLNKSIPRAHSVVILNDADTGKPCCIINTPLLSTIRTASVSGLVIKYFDRIKNLKNVNIGITGWGPIGQYHYKLCLHLLKNKINKISVFDIKGVDKELVDSEMTVVTKCWQDAYKDADIFITCTVSNESYIDIKPKRGSLHLNVSLRDYKVDVFNYFKNSIIVDNWEEVCREKTDIENMFHHKGLQKEDTKSIIDIVVSDCLKEYRQELPILFNPMGMAVFDIAIGNFYFKKAINSGIGNLLE